MSEKTELRFLERIADIRRRVELKFDAKNPAFKGAKYITLGAVMEALQPLLDEHGLVLIQSPTMQGSVFGIQTVIRPTRIECDDDGNAPDGQLDPQFIQGFWPCKYDGKPQDTASGTTYARRYSVLCCLAIVADEDDDGNTASGLGKYI